MAVFYDGYVFENKLKCPLIEISISYLDIIQAEKWGGGGLLFERGFYQREYRTTVAIYFTAWESYMYSVIITKILIKLLPLLSTVKL